MLKWVDTLDIAIELFEKHPDIDPQIEDQYPDVFQRAL